MEEDFTWSAVAFRCFEASDSRHLYFELFVLGLLWLHHDVHVLHFSLSGIDLFFLFLILFSFSLVGYDKLPPVDWDVGILDSSVVVLSGEMHESFDILRIIC